METSKQKIKRAIELLNEANDLLDNAYKEHLKASYAIDFNNLIDKNGDTIIIDLGKKYEPICVELMEIGRMARKSAQEFKERMSHG